MKKTLITLAMTALSTAAIANTQSDYAHFSFAIDPTIETIQTQEQTYQSSSNEYWMAVTGAQLQKGIQLPTSQSGVTILLSAGSQTSQSLDSGLVELLSTTHNQSVLKQKVSASDLASTGVFDETMALVTEDNAPAGVLVLSTSQALNDKDRYVVTVKEKNSTLLLNMDINKQSFVSGQPIQAKASIQSQGKPLNITNVSAQLIAPDGETSPVLVSASQRGDISLHLIQPEKVQSPRYGLYELKLSTTAEHNGISVKRNGKLALALVEPTASLSKVTLETGKQLTASIEYKVNKPSRFEVRGTLFGTDKQGQLVPVMESHAAHTSHVGDDSLTLPFDMKILNSAGVSAPWELKDLRLYDQQQLGLLERYTVKTAD